MTSTTDDAPSDTHSYSGLEYCDTNNATRIGWPEWECFDYWPADYQPEQKWAYYRYLDRKNSGLQNGRKRQNKSYTTYQINRNLAECISGRIGMPEWQRRRATSLLVGLLRSNMGLKAEIVAFCVCAYVIEENEARNCHPQKDEADRDPLLEDMRRELDISQKQFSSVYGKVAHRIRTGNLDVPRHDKYMMDSYSPNRASSTVKEDYGGYRE